MLGKTSSIYWNQSLEEIPLVSGVIRVIRCWCEEKPSSKLQRIQNMIWIQNMSWIQNSEMLLLDMLLIMLLYIPMSKHYKVALAREFKETLPSI